MILTVTANPAIDRLLPIGAELVRGAVLRTDDPIDQAGGKGVNVARVITAAKQDALAVFPAPEHDSFIRALENDPHSPAYIAVNVPDRVRVNLTLAEPRGVTTKLNAPGAALSAEHGAELTETIVSTVRSQPNISWVALCGSLPPGLPEDWYAQLLERLGRHGVRIALDASGAPLARALEATTSPSLIKPNREELAELLSIAPEEVTRESAGRLIADFCLQHPDLTVLLTLGSVGAVLGSAEGAWFAPAPEVIPRSTVGAGDAALAGYLMSAERGLEPEARLLNAVKLGSAATARPGTSTPTPGDVASIADVTVHRIA